MTDTNVVDAADEIFERFKKSGWTLTSEDQFRTGPGGHEWQWLLSEVLSKFVAATSGQNIEFVDATIRDESKIEFLVITADVLLFLSLETKNASVPALRTIPRSHLRSLNVVRGVALKGPRWINQSDGLLIEVDYGFDVIKTLPLNKDDVHISGWGGNEQPTVLADLEKLLPGLMQDLNQR